MSDKTKGVEWLSAMLVIAWGIVLVWPGETFHPTDEAYRYFLLIATEERWGTAAIALGLFHMVALNAHRCAFGREGRLIALVHSIGWWTLVGVLRFLEQPPAPSWLTCFVMAGTMSYSMICLLRDKPGHRHEPLSQHRDAEPHQA